MSLTKIHPGGTAEVSFGKLITSWFQALWRYKAKYLLQFDVSWILLSCGNLYLWHQGHLLDILDLTWFDNSGFLVRLKRMLFVWRKLNLRLENWSWKLRLRNYFSALGILANSGIFQFWNFKFFGFLEPTQKRNFLRHTWKILFPTQKFAANNTYLTRWD